MRHKAAERDHAIARFEERLGIKMTHIEYLDICAACADRTRTKYCGFSHTGRQIIQVTKWKGFDFKVIFDQMTNRVVTVLPNTIRVSG